VRGCRLNPRRTDKVSLSPTYRRRQREAETTEAWLSVEDIAQHLGVSKDTVYTWVANKGMPAHKVGRLWKFQASEIDDWVRSGGAATQENEG